MAPQKAALDSVKSCRLIAFLGHLVGVLDAHIWGLHRIANIGTKGGPATAEVDDYERIACKKVENLLVNLLSRDPGKGVVRP